jgi:hypothetical protein
MKTSLVAKLNSGGCEAIIPAKIQASSRVYMVGRSVWLGGWRAFVEARYVNERVRGIIVVVEVTLKVPRTNPRTIPSHQDR